MLTHNWRASSKILLNFSACLLLVAKVLALGWVKTSKRRIDSRSGMVAAGLRDITALRIKNSINWTENKESIGISFLSLLGTSITYIHLLGTLQVVHSDSKHSRPRSMARFARITDHDKGSWSLATYPNIQIVRVTFLVHRVASSVLSYAKWWTARQFYHGWGDDWGDIEFCQSVVI